MKDRGEGANWRTHQKRCKYLQRESVCDTCIATELKATAKESPDMKQTIRKAHLAGNLAAVRKTKTQTWVGLLGRSSGKMK